MKKIALGLMVVCLSSVAFGAYKTMHKKKQVKKTTSSVAVNKTNIKSVMMGRSACFGQCPSYTIEIFETGMLRYTGKSHTKMTGTYEKNIGAEKTGKFIAEFNSIRPDTLHYMYEKRIADLPGIYYFIAYPDSVKRVMNADEGPELLREWAIKIDSFAKVDQSWKKVEDANQKK